MAQLTNSQINGSLIVSGTGSFLGSFITKDLITSGSVNSTGNISTSGSFIGYGGALTGISASGGGGVGSSALGVAGSLATWTNSGSIQPVKATIDSNGNGSFIGSLLVGSLYSQGNIIANGSVYGYGGTLTGLGGGLTGAGTSGSIATWSSSTNVSYQNASIDSNSNAKFAGSVTATNGSFIGSVIAAYGVIPNLLPQGVLPSGSIPSLTSLYIPQGQLVTGSLPNTISITGSVLAAYGSFTGNLFALNLSGTNTGDQTNISGSAVLSLPQGVLPVGSIPALTAYIPQGQLITGSLPNTINISGSVIAPFGSFADEIITRDFTATSNGSFVGSTIASVSRVSGSFTGSYLELSSNGNSDSGSQVLLRFNSDRPWSFRTIGSQATTALVLRDEGSTKQFKIQDTLGSDNIIITPSISTGTPTTMYIKPYGSTARAFEIDGGNTIGSPFAVYGSSTTTSKFMINYLGSVMVGVLLPTHALNVLGTGSFTGSVISAYTVAPNLLPQGVLPSGSIPSLSTLYIPQGAIPYGSLNAALPQGVLPVGSIPSLTAYIPQGQLITGSLPNTITISQDINARHGSFTGSVTAGSLISNGNLIVSGSLFGYGGTLSGISGGLSGAGTSGSIAVWNSASNLTYQNASIDSNSNAFFNGSVVANNIKTSGSILAVYGSVAGRVIFGSMSEMHGSTSVGDVSLFSVINDGHDSIMDITTNNASNMAELRINSANTFYGGIRGIWNGSYNYHLGRQGTISNGFGIYVGSTQDPPPLQFHLSERGYGSFIGSVTAPNIIVWKTAIGSTTVAPGNGYITGSLARVIFTLPSSSLFGDKISISGSESGGWALKQNANQFINFGNSTTTVGTTGSLHSNNRYNSVELVCTRAGSEWNVISSVGTIGVK